MAEITSIDLTVLREQLEIAKLEGKNVVMDDRADKAVATLKDFERQIKFVIDALKAEMPAILEPFNATKIKGKYCTISIGKPRGTSSYFVDEEGSEYLKQQISNVIDVDKIEAYIEDKGQLPKGVHRNDPKPVISIRAKGLEDE